MSYFWTTHCTEILFTSKFISRCQEPPFPHRWLGWYWGVLTGDMEDRGKPWYNIWFSNMCTKFQLPSLIRSVSRTTLPLSVNWRTWGFLIGDMEDMERPWHNICSSYVIPNLWGKIQLSSMIRSVSRTNLSSAVTWWTLRVADGRLGWWGIPWHHKFTWLIPWAYTESFRATSIFLAELCT